MKPTSTNDESPLPQGLQRRVARLAKHRQEPVEDVLVEAVGQYVAAAEYRIERYRAAVRSPLLSKEQEDALLDRLYQQYADPMDRQSSQRP